MYHFYTWVFPFTNTIDDFSSMIFLGIISYMIDEATPPSTEVTTLKAMKSILHAASDVTIIGCFTGEDDAALEMYQQVGMCNPLYYDYLKMRQLCSFFSRCEI